MKGFKFSGLLGALAIAFPTAVSGLFGASAIAQTTPNDQAYLDDLHSFLQSQDAITYTMATQAMTPEQNVWAAQMFCQSFASGVSPTDAYTVYTSAALNQASAYGQSFTEEMAYAVGLYGGTVMNLGASYYCPEYQPEVAQALQSL